MEITRENIKQRLDELEQKNTGVDYHSNHYVIVKQTDEMIDEDRTFDIVILYALVVRANDALTEDNCLPLYRLEWHYDCEEFQCLMEQYGNDFGALDWTKPDAVSLMAGWGYDLEHDNICLV